MVIRVFLILEGVMGAFKAFEGGKTWIEAERRCRDWGGNLANIKSRSDLINIQTVTEDYERQRNQLRQLSFWIGANDFAKRGKWTWISTGVRIRDEIWSRN
jgi:hypothetical protein